MKKKVMVVGAGAREHQLALAYLKSSQVDEVLVTPGNEGMINNRINQIPLNIKIDPSTSLKDGHSFLKAAQQYQPDLIDVAQDDALAAGTVDLLTNYGFRVFGPTQAAAEIESNKAWARDFMKKYGLPTPKYKSFKAGDREAISYAHYLLETNSTIFFKASGLYAGKGVIPVTKENLEESFAQLQSMGQAAETFLVEEGLEGEEFSYYALVDGTNYLCFKSAQDNKRVFNRDQGPNTGGMGANSPALVTQEIEEEIEQKIIGPTITGMNQEGRPYTGIMYLGGIRKDDLVKIIEFNARWGDPEVQVVLPGIKNDYFELVSAAIDGKLNEIKLIQDNQTRVCVVGASAGYPGNYDLIKGKTVWINNKNIPSGVHLLSAGLKYDQGKLKAAGGRLFSVIAAGNNVSEARSKALMAMAHCDIEDNGLHYRTDIAWRDAQRIQKIVPLYSGKREDFVWVGFGSGSGTNLRECAKVIKPKLIFSDREKADLLNLDEFTDVQKLVINGYNICGSWKKAQGHPETEAEYEQKCVEYNELIFKKLREFEKQIGKPIDLIVLGGYMRLIKEPLLSAYKDRIINVHPADLSILKDNKRVYVGDNAVFDAIKAGEKKTKSSVILVDGGVDNGEILTVGPEVAVEEFANLEEYANAHQDKQKEWSDWPALTTALKLIAEGRLALGTEKKWYGEWRRVYLDGNVIEYGGFKVKKMIDETFRRVIEANTGCAVIMAGSDSDKDHINKVAESLRKYEIPHKVLICSAHKQPEKLIEIIKEYNETGGSVAFVAIAGGTDALSGTLSFHALGPVISCPPDAPNKSCLTNPPGSSNAYISNPKNVGKFIAQMYAGINLRFKELLVEKNKNKINSLVKGNADFQIKSGRGW